MYQRHHSFRHQPGFRLSVAAFGVALLWLGVALGGFSWLVALAGTAFFPWIAVRIIRDR
jgi:hypothetical protein